MNDRSRYKNQRSGSNQLNNLVENKVALLIAGETTCEGGQLLLPVLDDADETRGDGGGDVENEKYGI